MLNLKTVKDFLVKLFKERAVKFALKKILGSAAAGGFKGWLIKLIITELYEEIGEPLIKAALNQLGYYYDKVDGNVQVKRLEIGRRNNDQNTYDRASDDILS